MKFLKNLFIVIVVLAVVLVVVGFFLPKTSHVERSIVIEASQDTVFQEVNSFENYNNWSPWFKLDPDAEYTFSGPDSGVGATMAWDSEKAQVGVGSQEIVESTYPNFVKAKLLFGEDPNPGYISYTIEELGPRQSKLTWAFDADFGNNIVGRYFGMFMDGMLGPKYEEGLQALKEDIES
ncbi:SRPBCC family protein [Kangiella marina]|uniref:Polyketide cyclase n=1 Tax=Kangiella marina TaxID=1079178 RepID=A0ABP8ILV4_9GAMM